MAFDESGRATSPEFQKRLAELFGAKPSDHPDNEFREVKSRLEAELDDLRRKAPEDYADVSVTRQDVLRRIYTEKHV